MIFPRHTKEQADVPISCHLQQTPLFLMSKQYILNRLGLIVLETHVSIKIFKQANTYLLCNTLNLLLLHIRRLADYASYLIPIDISL